MNRIKHPLDKRCPAGYRRDAKTKECVKKSNASDASATDELWDALYAMAVRPFPESYDRISRALDRHPDLASKRLMFAEIPDDSHVTPLAMYVNKLRWLFNPAQKQIAETLVEKFVRAGADPHDPDALSAAVPGGSESQSTWVLEYLLKTPGLNGKKPGAKAHDAMSAFAYRSHKHGYERGKRIAKMFLQAGVTPPENHEDYYHFRAVRRNAATAIQAAVRGLQARRRLARKRAVLAASMPPDMAYKIARLL